MQGVLEGIACVCGRVHTAVAATRWRPRACGQGHARACEAPATRALCRLTLSCPVQEGFPYFQRIAVRVWPLLPDCKASAPSDKSSLRHPFVQHLFTEHQPCAMMGQVTDGSTRSAAILASGCTVAMGQGAGGPSNCHEYSVTLVAPS